LAAVIQISPLCDYDAPHGTHPIDSIPEATGQSLPIVRGTLFRRSWKMSVLTINAKRHEIDLPGDTPLLWVL